MRISSLLIANRGEIAICIARAASELGLRIVTVFSEDDARTLHIRKADEAHPLRGRGPAAYLDGEQLVAVARATCCDVVHPGYGFLSEQSSFAHRCAQAGLIFVGPQPDVLELFGDKGQARALARDQGVPVIAGTSRATTLEEAEVFLRSPEARGAILLKALAGGGGRGMRVVERPEELAGAYERCRSEARMAFGHDGVLIHALSRNISANCLPPPRPTGTSTFSVRRMRSCRANTSETRAACWHGGNHHPFSGHGRRPGSSAGRYRAARAAGRGSGGDEDGVSDRGHRRRRVVSLCDTSGFMVGPEAEKTATVRHVSRMFVTAASLGVPFFSVVLRKGYGLGAQAMTGGSFHAPFFIVAWPGGEFGGMGLEGAVRPGYRKELAAISDPQERQARFEAMVNEAYQRGKALNMASYLEIDDVIDPVETRRWIVRGLRSLPAALPVEGKRRPCVDTW